LHVSLLRSHIKIHSTAYYSWPALKNGLGAITGFVTTDDSAAVFGATIEVLDLRDSLLRKADVDSYGTFKILNIPPGLYTINVFDVGYKKATLNNLEIKANAIIHVEVHLITEEAHLGMKDKLGPNESLPPKKRRVSHKTLDRLAEPAVDDFAARCWTDLEASDWNVRATNYMVEAVRRRSLAPVR